MADKNEPTRMIGEATPAPDGTLRAQTTLSPKACRVRARVDVPPSKVMPIIVIPGIMGSNLRVGAAAGAPGNAALTPGSIAWRPPNGVMNGLKEAEIWEKRTPKERQEILNGARLEVDGNGPIELSGEAQRAGLNVGTARDYGWGEVHWESYGPLLMALRLQFGKFIECAFGDRTVESSRWTQLNRYRRSRWGKVSSNAFAELKLEEVERLAENWYPVYASGYNWLLSNENSANRLRARIEEIIDHWNTPELDCRRVLLVTHSMGGLVARACSKQIPEKIAGIVHICMPTLGAPVCYRRIACGTETSSPSNGWKQNKSADKFADIAGKTAAETNPVMAFAPGALELLPTHLYPQPWLFASTTAAGKQPDLNHQLPVQDVYGFYARTDLWYRLFDPDLLDPAGAFANKQAAVKKMTRCVMQAAHFHKEVLQAYFHPNSYAVYGSSTEFLSYGQFTWSCNDKNFSVNSLPSGKYSNRLKNGVRSVTFGKGMTTFFGPSVQEVAGDGTVPHQSASACDAGVKASFALAGFSHQGVFSEEPPMTLTMQLVARAILSS